MDVILEPLEIDYDYAEKFLTAMTDAVVSEIKEIRIKFDLKSDDEDSKLVNEKLGKYVIRFKPVKNVDSEVEQNQEALSSPNLKMVRNAISSCRNGFIIIGAGFEAKEIMTLSKAAQKIRRIGDDDNGLQKLGRGWAKQFIMLEPNKATKKIVEIARKKKMSIISLNASVSLKRIADAPKEKIHYIYESEVDETSKGKYTVTLMNKDSNWSDLIPKLEKADLLIFAGSRFRSKNMQTFLKCALDSCPRILILGLERGFNETNKAEAKKKIGETIYEPVKLLPDRLGVVLTDKAERIFSDYYKLN